MLNNADVRSRVAELRQEIESNLIRLRITERAERLKAAQERFDAMREVIEARKTGDWSRALKTGLCVVKKRVIGTGKKAKVIEEYEVDTGLLNAMADLEKQVAIETGQWTEKQDLNLKGQLNERATIVARAFSVQELEAMQAQKARRLLCKTGGSHRHKYRAFKELQMLSLGLTGADQESEQETKKERRAHFLGWTNPGLWRVLILI